VANLRELLDKRATAIAGARAILNKAETEKRDVTPEEQTQWDALMTEAASLKTQIDREERMLGAESEIGGGPVHQRQGVGDDGQPAGHSARAEDVEAFVRSFENPRVQAMARERRQALDRIGTPEARLRRLGAFQRFLGPWMLQDGLNARELRGLQADLDTSGGYLRPPEEFVNQIIMGVDNLVYIRQLANVLPPVGSAVSLGVPTLEADPSDPAWTGELSIGAVDTTMSFGKRTLTPHKMAKYIKISKDLLRFVPSVDTLVRQRLSYKFGVAMENAYQNGSGAGEPLGVFTASDNGISTGRDVSTGNTATSMTFDGLIEAKYALNPQYYPRARWMFHSDGAKQLSKLKDGENNYIWRESVRVGEPDRCLGFPIDLSAYTPHTFSASQYVGLLASWRDGYWIADAMAMEFQLLVELFAATDEVALTGKLYSDGMPVLEEAFVRVKLGT
jgi:HK97 family phage major capsid protein